MKDELVKLNNDICDIRDKCPDEKTRIALTKVLEQTTEMVVDVMATHKSLTRLAELFE